MAEINRKLSRKILNLRYGDKKKKTQITNWKSITKLFKQNEYVNSVPEVSRLLKSKHDIKLSKQKIKEHLEQKLSRLRSLDWEEYKGYKKISKYIKNQDGRWIPHRRQIYIYWYKFLQLAIVKGRKIDWEKYKGWSGSNFVLVTTFLIGGKNTRQSYLKWTTQKIHLNLLYQCETQTMTQFVILSCL